MARDDWKALGEAIRQRREDLKLTQEHAAMKADVSTAVWRIVETAARTNVLPSNLRAICRALDWSPDSYKLILDGEAPVEASAPVVAESVPDPQQPARLADVNAIRDELAVLSETVDAVVAALQRAGVPVDEVSEEGARPSR